MLQLLGSFAALSMSGTLLLSLLPKNGMKSTAAFVIGLMTLLCWMEGIARLLQIDLAANVPPSVLAATSIRLEDATSAAAQTLRTQWEAYE